MNIPLNLAQLLIHCEIICTCNIRSPLTKLFVTSWYLKLISINYLFLIFLLKCHNLYLEKLKSVTLRHVIK